MKISYYRYWIERNMDRYRHSVRPFLHSFSQVTDMNYRRSFTDGADNLYLYHIRGNLYLFVVTKDQELIKTISANTLSHDDIYQKLNRGESIGFASYIHLEDEFFGMACTIHGPKVKRLGEFVNKIFHSVGITDCIFCCAPFEAKSTPREAIGFHFKSAVRVAVAPGNPLFNTIKAWASAGDDVRSIVVEIKPSARRSMASAYDGVLLKAREQGIESIVVRAKAELEDQLTDFHVVGCGGLSRPIRAKEESDICDAVLRDIASNGNLREALQEYRGDNAYENTSIQGIRRFGHIDRWNRHLAGNRT